MSRWPPDETLIEDLALAFKTLGANGTRALTTIRNNEVVTVGQARGMTDREWIKVPGFGWRSWRALTSVIGPLHDPDKADRVEALRKRIAGTEALLTTLRAQLEKEESEGVVVSDE